MFDWVLDSVCFLVVIIYMALVVSMYILLFQNVVQDCSFKEFFIFQIQFSLTQSIFMKWLSVAQ